MSDALAHSLRDTLLALTRIKSPIGEEKELCDYLAQRLAHTLGERARAVVKAVLQESKP